MDANTEMLLRIIGMEAASLSKAEFDDKALAIDNMRAALLKTALMIQAAFQKEGRAPIQEPPKFRYTGRWDAMTVTIVPEGVQEATEVREAAP